MPFAFIVFMLLLFLPLLSIAEDTDCPAHFVPAVRYAFTDTVPEHSERHAADSAAARSLSPRDSVTRPGKEPANPYRFRPTQLIAPVSLICLGAVGTECFKRINDETREELQRRPHEKYLLADYTQFAPLTAVFGLKLCGVRSRHGYAQTAVIAATSYLFMASVVNVTKNLVHIQRPDGTTYNSFPSGHTATAFVGADLLRREYWETSPWIGVAGYVVAGATGFLRMYNDRHWLTDVVAGAGIGILSVQAAYWLYPVFDRLLFKRRRPAATAARAEGAPLDLPPGERRPHLSLLPAYTPGGLAFSASLLF